MCIYAIYWAWNCMSVHPFFAFLRHLFWNLRSTVLFETARQSQSTGQHKVQIIYTFQPIPQQSPHSICWSGLQVYSQALMPTSWSMTERPASCLLSLNLENTWRHATQSWTWSMVSGHRFSNDYARVWGARLATYDNIIFTWDVLLTAVYIEYTPQCFTGIFTGSRVRIFERDWATEHFTASCFLYRTL